MAFTTFRLVYIPKLFIIMTCYGASTDGTVTELKTDVTELLRTLVRGSAGALALCI